MIPYILAAVGGYLIGDSLKGQQQYADGGKILGFDELDESNRNLVNNKGFNIGDEIKFSVGEKGNMLFPYREIYGKIIGFIEKGKYKELYVKTMPIKGLGEGTVIDYYSIIDKMADGGMVDQNKRVRFRIAYVIGVDEALKYLDREYAVSPFNLIESAVRKGFITIDEIDENLWNAAVEVSEDIDKIYRDSEQGIGSSDKNAFISRMLNAAGIKIDVIDNKYQRI